MQVSVISRTLVVVVGGSYLSAEMQSTYSKASAKWAGKRAEKEKEKQKPIN